MAGEATYRLGNSVKVTIGDNTIGGQQDCTLTMESDTGETTTKDSGMWSDAEVTGLSWSVDCSGLIPVSDAAVTALETAWKTGNKVTIKYGNTIMPELYAVDGQRKTAYLYIQKGLFVKNVSCGYKIVIILPLLSRRGGGSIMTMKGAASHRRK